MKIQQQVRILRSSQSPQSAPRSRPSQKSTPARSHPGPGSAAQRKFRTSLGRRLTHVKAVRTWMRRSEPRKFIFKDGKVQENTSPYALLNRSERQSAAAGVVRFITVEQLSDQRKRRKA